MVGEVGIALGVTSWALHTPDAMHTASITQIAQCFSGLRISFFLLFVITLQRYDIFSKPAYFRILSFRIYTKKAGTATQQFRLSFRYLLIPMPPISTGLWLRLGGNVFSYEKMSPDLRMQA